MDIKGGEKKMIYLTIKDQEMTGIVTSPIVRGQVNFVQIKTFFDAAWDELDKTYQFKNGDNVVEIASNDEIVDLPFEASQYPGALEITVIGTKLDVDGVTVLKKATVNSLRYKVACNNEAENPDNVGDITPTLVEQIRQIAETAEDKAEEAERITALIWAAYEKGELNGKDGVDGKDGKDGTVGRDGVSPTFDTAQVEGGAKITIVDVEGTHEVFLENGPQGEQGPRGEIGPRGERGLTGNSGANGKDGVSPTVSTQQTSTGAKITITDAKGTHTAEVLNGKDGKDGVDGKDGTMSFEELTEAQKATLKGDPGEPGADGKDGANGKDGVSPTVSTTQTSNGAAITITDVKGSHTVTLLNGKDGKDGNDGKNGSDGATGPSGADGYSPLVTVTQTETGATITATDKNGTTTAQINHGKDGKDGTGGGGSGGESPTGTIISYMGTIAPSGYLFCDGAVVNINDYPNLASHFETQFGAKNHFGGDGSTTFGLPDLRNEFLRGYHGDGETQLSGEIGEHQEATQHVLNVITNSNGQIQFRGDGKQANTASLYRDSEVYSSEVKLINTTNTVASKVNDKVYYTSRPTNVAVLYCIKY